ncbi:hypothetical protein Q3G72_028876 [Acer saccharum]|nr:hypothetical protein Q3G72_028876 [Acer saccharum]
MFTEEELIPTEVESGLWYYQGIDEVGNLYPDEATIADILGTGDLTPSADDGAELREADTVRQARSSSRASHQHTNGAGPSTVPISDRSVPFAPSNAPSSVPTVERRSLPASARYTRLRFMSSRRREAPDHLEHQFTDVINAVEALREEIRKSERDRKESDKGLGRQRDSVQASHEDIAALPRRDSVPPSLQDSVEASHEDTAVLPRRDSVPPPQQDSAAVHNTETFDQGASDGEQSLHDTVAIASDHHVDLRL